MSTDNPTDVLITGATVVTLDDDLGTIDDGAVAVRDGRIAAVGPSTELARDHAGMVVVDGRGKAVLPGFINSHTHTVLLVLRGTVEDMAGDAIFGYMTPISFAMTPDERAAIARLGCLEGILSGTTTMVEPFRHVAGYAQGMVDTGLRLYLSENAADALTLKIRHGVYEHDRAFGQEFLDRTIELIERFHGVEDGRVHCQISAHAPDVCSPWMLDRLNQLKSRYGLTRTVHLSQSPKELNQIRDAYDRTSAQYLDDNDWLGPGRGRSALDVLHRDRHRSARRTRRAHGPLPRQQLTPRAAPGAGRPHPRRRRQHRIRHRQHDRGHVPGHEDRLDHPSRGRGREERGGRRRPEPRTRVTGRDGARRAGTRPRGRPRYADAGEARRPGGPRPRPGAPASDHQSGIEPGALRPPGVRGLGDGRGPVS